MTNGSALKPYSLLLLGALLLAPLSAMAADDEKSTGTAPPQPDATVSTLDDEPLPLEEEEQDVESSDEFGENEDLGEDEMEEIERGYADEKGNKGV